MNEFEKGLVHGESLPKLVEKLQVITQHLLQDAQQENWEAFLEHAQQRAMILEQFTASARNVQSQKHSKAGDDLNHWIKNEFRKVAKVDQEIGDIMDRKREELISKILETQNGQKFLKNYKNKVNFERIVSKIY